MTRIKDFPDEATLLATALGEAFERCNYRSGAFMARVGGMEGLARLLREDKRNIRKKSGMGPKSRAVIETTKDIIMEWISEGAEESIRAMAVKRQR